MNHRFGHENLEVSQGSLAFIAWLEPILQKLPKSLSVTDHKTCSDYRLHEGSPESDYDYDYDYEKTRKNLRCAPQPPP